MPIDKNRKFRIDCINELLKNKAYTKKELLEIIRARLLNQKGIQGYASRSFDKDIQSMRDVHRAPIEVINKHYLYTEGGFDIYTRKLAAYEIDKIKEACLLLRELNLFDIYEELESIYNKLEANAIMHKVSNSSYIQFDNSPNTAGTEYLADLLSAILNKNVVKFTYKPYMKEALDVLLHPYLLKEYNARWYIIGYDNHMQKIYNYALDRFCSPPRIATVPYYKDKNFEAITYFQHIVGVTLYATQTVETVVLKIATSRYPYIESVKLHRTQQVIKQNKKYVLVEYKVIINYEFINKVCGLGADAEVIKPLSLREKMATMATKLGNIYLTK